MKHIPYLWALGIVVSGLLSWFSVFVLVRMGFLKSNLKLWLARVILLVFFLITVAATIVAFGSMLITGRTM